MSPSSEWVVWGSKGHAMVLADAIALRRGKVVALIDNDPSAVSCLEGVPLCRGEAGLREWIRAWRPSAQLNAAVAVGGSRGADRIALASVLDSMGLMLEPVIHPTASVSPSARIGPGCHVLANVVLAAGAKLDSMVIVNNGAVVDHECTVAAGVHVAPGAVLCGCVRVGECAMVGAGATVLPRIAIGRGSVVGAGATVTRDVPDGAVVAGVPARPVRRV